MAKKARAKRSKKARSTWAYKPDRVKRSMRDGPQLRSVYNPQTGEIGGAAARAQSRLEALTRNIRIKACRLRKRGNAPAL